MEHETLERCSKGCKGWMARVWCSYLMIMAQEKIKTIKNSLKPGFREMFGAAEGWFEQILYVESKLMLFLDSGDKIGWVGRFSWDGS